MVSHLYCLLTIDATLVLRICKHNAAGHCDLQQHRVEREKRRDHKSSNRSMNDQKSGRGKIPVSRGKT